jgi:hypothetical protein
METALLIDTRFIMMFSFILASGALCPEAPERLSRKLLARWNRFKNAVRAFRIRRKPAFSRSFWEIDLTNIEP